MERFGLNRDSLAKDNPGIITCAITGFGSTGPGAELAGYDFVVQAMSGIMHITGEVDGEPSKIGSAMVDKLTGLYAAIGILAAVQERHQTGLGQHVEVSLMQSALAGLLNVGAAHTTADIDPGRHGNRHPSIAPYEPYQASDGPVIIAAASPVLWERLCEEMGRTDWMKDPRFKTNEDRLVNIDALATEINKELSKDTAAAWVERLQKAGIPVGMVNDVRAAFVTAETLGLDPVVTFGDDENAFRSVRSPLNMETTPPTVRRTPPTNNQHGEEIRRELEDS
jgi:crotonobetainyl-CoA:carnitine CoA-transferase CaiB-like acyl-CoA transferase